MTRPALPEGPYLVVGLARSGVAAARMLAAHGEVIGVDSGEPAAGAEMEGIEVHTGSDGVELLERARTVVKSPGVSREAPVVAAALERGIEVTGELELAWRLLPNRFVAVTGTNGKTTTVELVGAIFRAAGVPVVVAGNVGKPLASLVGEVGPEVTVVCECSSFQLEDSSKFRPECAVLLNIETDHLDRHYTLGAYTQAKLRIFANQDKRDVAVVPTELEFLVEGGQEVQYFDEYEVRGGVLHVRGVPYETRLRGAHNHQNIAAAVVATSCLDVPVEAEQQALATFPGVPNRLEEVAEVGGVLYVNDSKATNVASAIRGLEAFEPGQVHAILGGSLKGGGFAALRAPLQRHAAAAYLIGRSADELEADLQGTVELHRCGDLEQAVAAASEAAGPGQVVLLSPACASYDQYPDYERRGEHFRSLVGALGTG